VRVLIVFFLCALQLVTLPGLGIAQQSLVTDPVAFEKDHFIKRCGAGTTFGDGFATQQDINNDKLMDVVINQGDMTCKGEKGPDCTDQGCPHDFYIQVDTGGYLLIATAQIYSYDFIKRFGNMVLVLKMHPHFCDRTDSEPCLTTVRVRGTLFTTISKK
jgi:hypothetical protein